MRTAAMNKGTHIYNLYAASRMSEEFYISLESFDFRTEPSFFRARYISAPVLTKSSIFHFFDDFILVASEKQLCLLCPVFNSLHWLAYN